MAMEKLARRKMAHRRAIEHTGRRRTGLVGRQGDYLSSFFLVELLLCRRKKLFINLPVLLCGGGVAIRCRPQFPMLHEAPPPRT